MGVSPPPPACFVHYILATAVHSNEHCARSDGSSMIAQAPPDQSGFSSSSISIAVFCMPLRGHLQRLLPLISGLSSMGHRTYVFTHKQFQRDIQQIGGHFIDLFSKYPLDSVDDSSIPFASRYVSFAGEYLEEILKDVRAYKPSLIIYDTYAVIGRIVGTLLGLPHVNVCAGHNRMGPGAVEKRRRSPVAISKACDTAVKKLNNLGLKDVTPYYYLCATSPYLNIYCEPPGFLRPADRQPFEPVAFFGSVQPDNASMKTNTMWFSAPHEKKLRLFISFGTVIWFYHAVEAVAALETLSRVIGQLRWVEAVISLGSWSADTRLLSSLRRPNVRVERYVDQWSVLKEANVFVTHHGLNSTHEAIFHGVPMISYPFTADQPALAQRCRELGLAIRLADAPLDCVRPKRVIAALNQLRKDRHRFDIRLAKARTWELEVIAARRQVIHKILDLTRCLPSQGGRHL
jgi:MGT family glycosyltransferase